MREIKFRAWSFHNKEIYQGSSPYPAAYHFEFYGNGNIGYCPTFPTDDLMSFYTDVEPEDEKMKIAVMQFTGLKDKTGKDIYEGDICEGHSDGIGVITWTEFDGGYDYIFTDDANVGIWEVKSNIKVIGNIYEHPHLLNKEAKDERSVATEAQSGK